jgi:hypothetical protein
MGHIIFVTCIATMTQTDGPATSDKASPHQELYASRASSPSLPVVPLSGCAGCRLRLDGEQQWRLYRQWHLHAGGKSIVDDCARAEHHLDGDASQRESLCRIDQGFGERPADGRDGVARECNSCDGVEHNTYVDRGSGRGGGLERGEGERRVGNPEHEYFDCPDGDGSDDKQRRLHAHSVSRDADDDAGCKRGR